MQKPILIFIGDEKPYENVTPAMAKRYAFVTLEKQMSTEEIFRALTHVCSVWMIRILHEQPNGDRMSRYDQQADELWSKLVGEQRVMHLPDSARVVDNILCILANEVGKPEEFDEDMKKRQTQAQQAVVFESVHRFHHKLTAPKMKQIPEDAGKSVLRRAGSNDETNEPFI